jgi:hypothetical protein
MERNTNKCKEEFLEEMLYQNRRWRNRKFDSRMDKGVLVGYSSTRKAYKCYNLILNKVVKSINVTVDETCRPKSTKKMNQGNNP